MADVRDSRNTKKRILNGAFQLFLQKNYEKVTVSDIENCIQLTRGAIFYYTRNKEELFKEVINTYILKSGDTENKIKPDASCSLKDFIDLYVEHLNETMILQQKFGIDNFHRCYISLIYQALQYYPRFDELMNARFQQEYEMWYNIILRAFTKKEIKQDLIVENVAKQFRYLYSGLSFESSFKYSMDITALKQLYYMYYEQIKL